MCFVKKYIVFYGPFNSNANGWKTRPDIAKMGQEKRTYFLKELVLIMLPTKEIERKKKRNTNRIVQLGLYKRQGDMFDVGTKTFSMNQMDGIQLSCTRFVKMFFLFFLFSVL